MTWSKKWQRLLFFLGTAAYIFVSDISQGFSVLPVIYKRINTNEAENDGLRRKSGKETVFLIYVFNVFNCFL